jgi:hypothetical protein
MNRFKGRPNGGLPEQLPAGETILWQGAPEWQKLAQRAFRIRIIVGYFVLLLVWRVGAALAHGHGLGFAAMSGCYGLLLAAASSGLFCAYAWLIARTTVYTITSRRVVITFGMALPKSINLPFARIEAADLRVHADGTGDIALRLPAQTRLAYLLLWPHVRSGAAGRTEPVLRCVAHAEAIAKLLAQALAASLPGTERAVRTRPVNAASAAQAASDLIGAKTA